MDSEAAASESFYAALPPDLSQGDLVQGVPWGVIDSPLTVCRADGGRMPNGAVPGRAHYNTIDQVSHLWENREIEVIHATGRKPGFGMVIWEDCQIDKFKEQKRAVQKWYVAVAPVLDLTGLSERDQETIRAGRRMAFFPLQAFPLYGLPESYVDLRLIWPIKQSILTDRVVALSPNSRAGLIGHLFTFLTARRLTTPHTCPSCGEALDPAKMFEDVRDV